MKSIIQTIVRLAGMLLKAVFIMAGKTVDADQLLTLVSKLTELGGDCITSIDQTVYFEYFPEPITASAATSGDCAGSYSYQWSTDNVFYYDIPGATAQDMTFTNWYDYGFGGTLTQIIWHHRKADCGRYVQ